MKVKFIKVISFLIIIYFFSYFYLHAEEIERKGVVDEVESTVIDSNTKESSSNQVQKSAPNESPDSISGELQQSSDIRRNILFLV